MADGFVMGPGEGERVSPAITLKVGGKSSAAWLIFEVADIGPGFDVGAHLHRNAEELFYVLEGQLDLLAFEPRVRTPGGRQSRDLTPRSDEKSLNQGFHAAILSGDGRPTRAKHHCSRPAGPE